MKAFYEDRGESLFVGIMTRYPFPLHVHEVVEVAVVQAGSCRMQIDGRSYRLGPGDAAVIFPLVPHSFDELSPNSSGFSAFFPASMIQEFANTFHSALPSEPVVHVDMADTEVRTAVRKLLQTAGEEPYAFRLAYLHLLLAGLLRGMRFVPTDAYSERGPAYRVVKYVYDHAFERISLASAAHSLGVSESHLSHLFSQQLNVNFRRFVNAIRIDRAKALMNDPHVTLTSVCYNCGFENMRTFRRAFVHETGMLPTAYLQELRTGAGVDGLEITSNKAES